jgi:peptidoglycan/xylan/chitin deacetylase (PgdA/CDA1 family)
MRVMLGTSVAALVGSVGSLDPLAVGCAAGSLAGAIGLGVAFPALRVFGPVLSHAPGDDGTLALTFDDGPHPVYTPRVLDALAAGAHRATFFLVGRTLARHPEVGRAIRDAGHTIGLHSHAHSSFNALFSRARLREDFQDAERAFEDALGERPRLYRPPVGLVNPNVMGVARERGVQVVAWSLRGLDGVRLYEPGFIRARVRRARAGDIVLLHDALHGRPDEVPPGVLALPGILADLAARGLRSVRLG